MSFFKVLTGEWREVEEENITLFYDGFPFMKSENIVRKTANL